MHWTKETLADVSEIISGFAFKSKDFKGAGIPVVKIKNINPPYVDVSSSECINEDEFDLKKLKRYELRTNDFVVAMTGATIGKVGRINYTIKSYLNQRVALIRPKPGIDQRFIYYSVISTGFENHIHTHIDSHSVQANISARSIGKFPVNLPPLQEQKAIAEVLSSLDDKIELLQKQNETLEALAQTLFRQWFIEEADNSWEQVEISKELTITIGKTPPRKESHWFSDTEGIPWLSIKDMGQQGIYINNTAEYLTTEAVQKHNVRVVPAESVLMSFKLTVGRVAINHQEMVTNEAIAHFYGFEQSRLTNYYVYLFLKQFNFRSLGSTSSIAQAVNSKTVKSIKIPVPHSQLIAEFTKNVEGLFEKIKLNSAQIQTLEQTRDTLLPKLMSGQVRVKLD